MNPVSLSDHLISSISSVLEKRIGIWRKPLGLSIYLSLEIVGMFLSLIILKKLLKLKDTFIICMAIASMGACVIAIGLAQASWIIYLSLPIGSLHGMLNPLTYAFMSRLIDSNEVSLRFLIDLSQRSPKPVITTSIPRVECHPSWRESAVGKEGADDKKMNFSFGIVVVNTVSEGY